jgi:hypothetical protein
VNPSFCSIPLRWVPVRFSCNSGGAAWHSKVYVPISRVLWRIAAIFASRVRRYAVRTRSEALRLTTYFLFPCCRWAFGANGNAQNAEGTRIRIRGHSDESRGWRLSSSESAQSPAFERVLATRFPRQLCGCFVLPYRQYFLLRCGLRSGTNLTGHLRRSLRRSVPMTTPSAHCATERLCSPMDGDAPNAAWKERKCRDSACLPARDRGGADSSDLFAGRSPRTKHRNDKRG